MIHTTNYRVDKWLLGITVLLLLFGLVMVASASMVISDHQYGYPWHFLIRQSVYVLFGLLILFVMMAIPMKIWKALGRWLLLLAIVLLLMVLLPGIGRVVNGSRRWIMLGFFTLQVSEVVKIAMVLYLADYLDRHRTAVATQFLGFVKPIFLLLLLGGLLLLQPDFGTTVVMTMVFLMMLFLANAPMWPFVSIGAVVAGLMTMLAILSPYRLARLVTFLHPWAHPYGSGYQLTQSLIAFGRGGVFGVGLGNSIQKLFYLPEAHTDFIFAVVGEELGLLGELALISAIVCLVIRGLQIGWRALHLGRRFEGFAAIGIVLSLGLQALINMGVNVGLLPTKGLTLPFVSYGGSSLLMNCVAVGLLLRIAREIEQ